MAVQLCTICQYHPLPQVVPTRLLIRPLPAGWLSFTTGLRAWLVKFAVRAVFAVSEPGEASAAENR